MIFFFFFFLRAFLWKDERLVKCCGSTTTVAELPDIPKPRSFCISQQLGKHTTMYCMKFVKKQPPFSFYNLTFLQEQYVFLHQAVMEALTCGNTEIAPQDLRIAMRKLATVHKSSQRTGFAQEFKVLRVYFSCFKYWTLVPIPYDRIHSFELLQEVSHIH